MAITRAPIEPHAAAPSDAGIVTLAFGPRGDARLSALGELRHLALLPADTLELDLSDPEERRFGDYELLELLGEGGMGIVYRARHLSLDREVAIKLLAAGPWASKEFIERFQREAQNAARMQHPNIVAIHEVGSTEELHYFSMRLVRGPSLAAVLGRDGALPPRRAAALMRTIAEAVDYAHRLGVLHLDLKPGNVLLDENGVPHVADFGLARRIEPDLGDTAEASEISGTPNYMAPEQIAMDARKLAPAADIWGLGAIFYELLTGQPPFASDSVRATLEQARAGELVPPRARVRALPRDLEAIVLQCLRRDPAARYASARALADDLGRFLEYRSVQARPLGPMQRMARWARRKPYVAALATLFALSMAIGLVATTAQWRRAESNARRATAVRDFIVGVFEQVDPDQTQGHPITAHQLLDKGEQQIERLAPSNAGTRADLRGVLGKLYWDIGDYARAEILLQQALDAAQRERVPDEVLARLLLDQARVQSEQNKYAAALANATRALDLSRRLGDVRGTGEARRQIGYARIGSGEAARAEPLLRQALADDLAHFGADDRAVADDKALLGDALLEQSRLDDSIAMSREALSAIGKAYGAQSGPMLNAMNNLAVALRNRGQYAQAEDVLREVVRIATTLYGPDNATTLSARSNFLIVLDSEGRYADALKERLSMLPAQAKLTSERPEILAYAYKNIAGEQLNLGHFADARASAEKALATWSNIEGSDSEWHSVAARQFLAQALQFEGRYAQAEKVLRETLDIQRHHEPPDSIWLNQTRNLLGSLLRAEHHTDAALRELQAALAALPRRPSPTRAQTLTQISLTALDSGDAASVHATAEKALAMARDTFPPGNSALASPIYALARADLAVGQPTQAEPLLREALALRCKNGPPEDPRVLQIEVALVGTLDALGKSKEAEALRGEIRPILRSQHTPAAAESLAQLNDAVAAVDSGAVNDGRKQIGPRSPR